VATENNRASSRLGSVMVSLLTIRPKVCVLKPGQDDGFLSAIKISSTPCFGGEVKPKAPCRRILRHIKERYQYERNIS
jgi:hypothetical protein